jgi:hypothetical protein
VLVVVAIQNAFFEDDSPTLASLDAAGSVGGAVFHVGRTVGSVGRSVLPTVPRVV